MFDSEQAVPVKKFPVGFSKYLCRTCRQLEGLEISENDISVRCGTNLVRPVAKKSVGRHKDCPHSQEGKLKSGVSSVPLLKKLAAFARHQKGKVAAGDISTETLQVRIDAYESRLLRESSRI